MAWLSGLLLTGLLPGYVHARGGLIEGHALAELRRRGQITLQDEPT